MSKEDEFNIVLGGLTSCKRFYPNTNCQCSTKTQENDKISKNIKDFTIEQESTDFWHGSDIKGG
jgi:uncharacterized protein YjaG (DUF416 family)